MKRQSLLLFLCLALTLLLARMDRDVTSFASIARWENVPALVIYTLLFRLMLAGASLTMRAIAGREERPHSG